MGPGVAISAGEIAEAGRIERCSARPVLTQAA